MKRLFVSLIGASMLIMSCSDDIKPNRKEEGFKPIYESKSEALSVSRKPPRTITNPGKIYIFGNLILVNERYEGIHVINNSNPAAPQILSFIKIAGNIDMAVKQNVLYADNILDLVAIDISDPTNPTVISRIPNVYNYVHQMYPQEDGWFECVDTSKGLVVGWQKVQLENPKCYR